MSSDERQPGPVPPGSGAPRRALAERGLVASSPLSRTVSEQVHRFIQHALFDGQLDPGDRLAEGELAAALGVSRTPIREALRQLDRDGLVVVVPHRGAFVRSLDPGRARQLCEARLLLEPVAARAAAAQISAGQLTALAPLVEAALDDARTGDLRGASRDNEAFHVALFQAAGRDVLLELWRRIFAEWQLFRVCAWRAEPGRPRAVASEHAALYEAVAHHDEELAGELMAGHIERAWAHVERVLAGGRPVMPAMAPPG